MLSTSNTKKLVIYDLGGVLYNIRFENTVLALQSLRGYNGTAIAYGVENQDEVFVEYDKGIITTAEFRSKLRRCFGFTCADSEIDAAWCAILLGLYPQDVLINPAHTTVLLSNISELHYEYIEHETQEIFSRFHNCYFSYRIHKRKPDPSAFLYVCEAEGFAPIDTILIDDSTANCDAARSLGITVYHHKPGSPLPIL